MSFRKTYFELSVVMFFVFLELFFLITKSSREYNIDMDLAGWLFLAGFKAWLN